MDYCKNNNETAKTRPEYSNEELGEVYGDYDYLRLPVNKIVVLPQVRGGENNGQFELTQSIKSTGRLLNPVDIALMSKIQLSNHLDFINGIWGTEANIDEFGEPNNGIYPVLIAGHSRLKSIKALQLDEKSPKSIVAKIHIINSSADFLSLQLAENTYNNIKPERRAMAIVEMFHYGFNKDAAQKDANHWSSYADFIRKNGQNISEEMLRDGIALTRLSPQVRDFVFAGKLYYGAAVEIGKNADIIMEYAKHRLGENAYVDDINKAYNYELAILINNLIESRKNTKGSLKRAVSIIRQKTSHMKNVINPPDADSYQMTMINTILDAPNIQRKEYIADIRKEYQDAIKRLKSQPVSSMIECLKLNSAITGEDLSEEINEARNAYKTLVGNKAIDNILK